MSQKAYTTDASVTYGIVAISWLTGAAPLGYTANTDYYLNGAGALVSTFTASGKIAAASDTIFGQAAMSVTVPAAFESLGLEGDPVVLLWRSTPTTTDWVQVADLPHFDGSNWSDSTGGGTIIESSTALVSALSGETPTQNLQCSKGAIHAFRLSFTNEDGTYPNYTAHVLKMVVSDLEGSTMFQLTGSISTVTSTGDSATFTTSADNTTDDIDGIACDATSLRYDVWDTTSGDAPCCGAFIVRQAVQVS